MLTNRRSFGGDFATQLWLNPVGNWAKYGDGDAYGASDIRANSYGIAGGLDFAYAPAGAFGFGGAYAEHDISARGTPEAVDGRSEEHTSELQSLMRTSYAVFCLKKKHN